MGQNVSSAVKFLVHIHKYLKAITSNKEPSFSLTDIYNEGLNIDFDEIYHRISTDEKFKIEYDTAISHLNASVSSTIEFVNRQYESRSKDLLFQVMPLITLIKIGAFRKGIMHTFCEIVLKTQPNVHKYFIPKHYNSIMRKIPFQTVVPGQNESKLKFGEQPTVSPCPKRSKIFEEEYANRSRNALNERLRQQKFQIRGYDIPTESHWALEK